MPHPSLRKVRWTQIPLGSIVLEAPPLFGASIPELQGYPVVTRRLRDLLRTKYQFLDTTPVTIIDPDFGAETEALLRDDRRLRQFLDVLPPLAQLKQDLRNHWRHHPGMEEGVIRQVQTEKEPYCLRKSWTRSVQAVIQENGPFLDQVWGRPLADATWSELLIRVLQGELPLGPAAGSLVDVGLDVSYSMENRGKSAVVLDVLGRLLPVLAGRLAASTWRLWLVSDRTVPIQLTSGSNLAAQDIPQLLKSHRLNSGETRFAPFYRQVLDPPGSFGHHLCLLFTDGVCSDRDQALRWAEKLGDQAVDYLQFVLHDQEELRTAILTPFQDSALDGVKKSALLLPGEELITRSDRELKDENQDHLRRITDLAEAARGGQIVLGWWPLTGAMTLDVYEQYLAGIL